MDAGQVKKKVAYVIVGENLTHPVLRRQVVELLGEVKNVDQSTSITVFLFYSIPSLISRRADLEVTRRRLSDMHIGFIVIPTLCPWPIPNFKLRRTAAGWRPAARWSRWSLRLFKLHALPVLLWIRLAGYRIFHCRSYPAASAAAFLKRFVPRTAIIFDPRSDFPEENVTAGNWQKDSADFRYWKNEERILLEQSNAVACIATSYVEAFRRSTPDFNYFIAPNNVSCSAFKRSEHARQRIRNSFGIRDDDAVFVYLGSLAAAGWHQPSFYRRFYDNVARFIDAPVFLFLVPQEIAPLVRETFTGCDRVIVASPQYDEIAQYMSAADIGMMFLHKAKIALGTKIVEYLAASLPVVVNRNCEGAVSLIREYPEAGLIVNLGLGECDAEVEFSGSTLERILSLLKTSSSLEAIARTNFDNSALAARYADQYSRIAGSAGPSQLVSRSRTVAFRSPSPGADSPPPGADVRIGAAIVLYHPDLGLLNRLLSSLNGQVADIFVIDNTPEPNIDFPAFFDKYDTNIKYIALRDNVGIAQAQNIAIAHCREAGCSHVLLLDQDSALSQGMVAELVRAEVELISRGIRVGAVGPLYVDEKTGETSRAIRHGYLWVRKKAVKTTWNDPVRTDYLIASGSLIRMCVLDGVGDMKGDLFIDSVDIEWGMRALRKGYISFMTPHAVLRHSVGDIAVRILGKQINLHSDVRHFYIVRNSVFLLRSGNMGAKWRSVTLLRIPKYLIVYSLWSKNRLDSLKLLLRGVLDGYRGRIGRIA